MPTIKTKKEMNLGELLCWAIDNKEQASLKAFYSKNIGVKFNASGYPCIEFEKKFLPTYETFTVEIKEEITEDTKLFLISRCIGKLGNVSYLYEKTTISKRLKYLPVECDITHFYIENDSKELVLIWTKEKGLVE